MISSNLFGALHAMQQKEGDGSLSPAVLYLLLEFLITVSYNKNVVAKHTMPFFEIRQKGSVMNKGLKALVTTTDKNV